MHRPNSENCVISFESNEDMDKALEELIYNSTAGFSGVDETTIIITKEQCEQLKKNNINHKHVD